MQNHFEQIKTNSKFCEDNLEFMDLGFVKTWDELVTTKIKKYNKFMNSNQPTPAQTSDSVFIKRVHRRTLLGGLWILLV